MKQNQAKRTSTTPTINAVKLTPEKTPEQHDDSKKIENETSPVDMSKSMSSITKKTPDNEFVVLRNKPSQPIVITPVRPQSIHTSSSPLENKMSPIVSAHSPIQKPPIADKSSVEGKTASPRTSFDKKLEFVSMKQYLELSDRITHVENKMQLKIQEMQSQIDDLEGKLKVESDLRRHFQVELEKVAQCVTQV